MTDAQMHTVALEPTAKTRVLILGGGFGGLYAARYLDKTIAAEPNVEVTLVSRENFVLFTPMLHEVAAGDLEMTDIVSPLRQMLKHVNFIEADVEAIDLSERQVTLAFGLQRQQKKLSYDHRFKNLSNAGNSDSLQIFLAFSGGGGTSEYRPYESKSGQHSVLSIDLPP
jgi:NADH dehydrogenase